MNQRTRLGLVVVLGGVVIGGAVAYTHQLARQSADQFGALPPGKVRLPASPPDAVVLTYLYYCTLYGSPEDATPRTLARLVKRAPWDDLLPPRTEFDDALAAAAAACGDEMTSKDWLAQAEYFGELPGALARANMSMDRHPFHAEALFGDLHGAGQGAHFLLALAPAACADGGAPIGITYSGVVGRVAPDDAAAQRQLARSRLLSENWKAFVRGNVPTLATFATHEDRVIRREAVQALARAGDRDAIVPLRERLDDPDEELRYIALLGLAELGDLSVELRLRALLGQDEDYLSYGLLHYRVVLALAGLGATDMRPELELMADWHSPVLFPREARAALRTLDQRARARARDR